MGMTEPGMLLGRRATEQAGWSPSIAVVMPAYNAAKYIGCAVSAVVAAARGAPVIVVDPGSSDETAALAEAHGATVIRLPQRVGPAAARNAGVEGLDVDVVLFIDADCVAHADVVDRVRGAFARAPCLVAVSGSCDAAPPASGFFSQYMNLRHHHTHQVARRENASFWSGCGAVDLAAFRRSGGFDAQRYPEPMIEDIELGQRLRTLGRTQLDADMQVTHLKRWTARSTIWTDIVRRAVPWSQLIAESRCVPDDLNLRRRQRVAAALAPLALAALAALVALPMVAPRWTAVPVVVVVASLHQNRGLVRCFARVHGAAFAFAGWAFHQIHLTYCAATLVGVLLATQRRPLVGRAGGLSPRFAVHSAACARCLAPTEGAL